MLEFRQYPIFKGYEPLILCLPSNQKFQYETVIYPDTKSRSEYSAFSSKGEV
jgi:hypothetical protein